MRVFAPELHIFPLRAILDEAREALGAPELDRILARFGVSWADLQDPTAWVSLRFVESLMEDIESRVADGNFVSRAMVRAMSPKYFGPLYPLFVAFGTARFTYQQTPRMSGRVDKTAVWECQHGGPGRVTMRRIPEPGASRETKTVLCRLRAEQLRRIPTFFNGAPARVHHATCVLRGDAQCAFDVEWNEPPPQRHGVWGALAGGLTGTLVAATAALTPWLFGWVAAVFALAGWALGRLSIARRELRARVQDIADHGQALDRVTQANEARYAELLVAKADVDKQVDQRTAELQRTSAELERTLDRLRELDRAKTDFFHSVSHELRTPLTLILEPLRYLLRGEDPPGGKQAALAAMQSNAEDLRGLVTDLLDLARIDAGAMPLRRGPVEPAGLIGRVLDRFAAAAKTRGVALEAELSGGAMAVLWDAGWIERALGNLVANALRHVERGGHVTVRHVEREGETVLEVADDGEGISAAEIGRVFDRFAQAGGGGRGGSGLGLAIVREAARLHGGDATVQSRLGEGAVFALRLPPPTEAEVRAARVAGEPSARIEERPLPRDLAVDVTEESVMPGPHAGAPLALVVEDDPDLRRYMAATLAERYRVHTATDGARGLALALEETPEVVVSDIAMPKLDGLGLCRALRSYEATRTVPVILVTAAADQERVLEGFEAGASDHVLKPFHARELLARVDVHVRLRALTREVGRRERLATLGMVAASVAHQVRNPLTTLASGLPAMRRRIGSEIDAPSLEMLDTMLDCARRIEQVTNDLLDLSRVDRAEDDDVRPGAGLLAAVRLARARVSSVDVRFDVDADEGAVLRGRAGDLNQVFLNLLDNAVRAVDDRGRIRVQARVEDGAYVVRVEDSGSGVPETLAERVFEPFWTSRPAGQGTGLGLAIARQVVEAHAGRITVGRSDLGGAAFEVRLPLTRPRAWSERSSARLSA